MKREDLEKIADGLFEKEIEYINSSKSPNLEECLEECMSYVLSFNLTLEDMYEIDEMLWPRLKEIEERIK